MTSAPACRTRCSIVSSRSAFTSDATGMADGRDNGIVRPSSLLAISRRVYQPAALLLRALDRTTMDSRKELARSGALLGLTGSRRCRARGLAQPEKPCARRPHRSRHLRLPPDLRVSASAGPVSVAICLRSRTRGLEKIGTARYRGAQLQGLAPPEGSQTGSTDNTAVTWFSTVPPSATQRPANGPLAEGGAVESFPSARCGSASREAKPGNDAAGDRRCRHPRPIAEFFVASA